MPLCLFRGKRSTSDQVLNGSVVRGDAAEHAIAQQVSPAVANVGNNRNGKLAGGIDQRRDECGAHAALASAVAVRWSGFVVNTGVRALHRSGERTLGPATGLRPLQRPQQLCRDCGGRQGAVLVATDAVGNGKQSAHRCQPVDGPILVVGALVAGVALLPEAEVWAVLDRGVVHDSSLSLRTGQMPGSSAHAGARQLRPRLLRDRGR